MHPLDVGSELDGRKFKLTRAFKVGGVDLAAGTLVTIESWTNGSPTVRVKPDAGGASGDVPKKLLGHAEAAVAGITQYGVGLDKIVRDYERGEKKIADEKARKGGPDASELAALERLQKNRQTLLDERLIQETMFNRFDASIKKWVDHYGTKLGFTGKKALDPEIVKSMLYEETQMGTEGAHLDEPATSAIRTRFNIGQGPIDSGAITMVHILREEDPALFALYKLGGIEQAMSDAQDELVRHKKLRSPDATEQARIDHLTWASGPGSGNWENFLWNFKGPGSTKTLFEAATEWLDAPAGTPRKFDYDFWIQAMVRLLFLKRKHTSSWTDAGARLQRQRDRCGEVPQARDEPPRQGQDGGEGQEALCGGQALALGELDQAASASPRRSESTIAEVMPRVEMRERSWGGGLWCPAARLGGDPMTVAPVACRS